MAMVAEGGRIQRERNGRRKRKENWGGEGCMQEEKGGTGLIHLV